MLRGSVGIEGRLRRSGFGGYVARGKLTVAWKTSERDLVAAGVSCVEN